MVFQFVQVGNDKGAEEYLRKLGTESEVAEYVHVILGTTVTEILDELKLQSLVSALCQARGSGAETSKASRKGS